MDMDDSRASNWSMEEAKQNLPAFPPLRKTIYVSKENHLRIKSCLFSCDENEKITLKPGWTNTLYSLLWENMKLPCPFGFGFAQINENPGESLLTVRGQCRECSNVVHINLPTIKLSDNGMAMHVSTIDTTGIVHKKKRFLSGTERSAVVKELQADGVYVWRRENANQKMEFCDPEPAHLYTEDVLRKAKQLDNDKQLGLINVTNPIRSVEQHSGINLVQSNRIEKHSFLFS
ncbi:unnamed protein product [Colias eurytheme]|nr:unnamed protein product [Colias eurytheme]